MDETRAGLFSRTTGRRFVDLGPSFKTFNLENLMPHLFAPLASTIDRYARLHTVFNYFLGCGRNLSGIKGEPESRSFVIFRVTLISGVVRRNYISESTPARSSVRFSVLFTSTDTKIHFFPLPTARSFNTLMKVESKQFRTKSTRKFRHFPPHGIGTVVETSRESEVSVRSRRILPEYCAEECLSKSQVI